MTDSSITIDVVAAAVLSYPMAHNRVPVISRIAVDAPETTALAATLSLEIRDAHGTLGKPQEHLVDLDGDDTLVLTDVGLVADPAAMLQVEENRPASIHVALIDDGRTLATHETPIELLAAQHWQAAPPLLALEMLAAFVMPNHPSVTQLISEASDILHRNTGSPSIQGYQADSERVDAIVQAVYEAMQARQIRYAEPPASWSATGQKIRTPGDVLDGRVGTCLDTVVVMAAALEQAGIRPLLWVVDGHAFLGYWRDEMALDGAAQTDVADVANLVDLGVIRLVETTMLTVGEQPTPFDHTHRPPAAAYLTGDLHSVIGVTDIRQARLAGILPLPARTRDDDGAVTVVEYHPAAHSALVQAAEPTMLTGDDAPAGPTAPLRVQGWKNALLDLSLRNRLIHFTERSGIELTVPDGYLSSTRDLLHAGKAIQLLPSDQFDQIHRERGVVSGGGLPPELLGDLLTRKRSVYTDVGADGYVTRMRNLAYRARTIVEETGANNLFLALGSLVWSHEGRDLRSPLVLLPVRLVGRSRRTAYRIELDEAGGSTPNYCLLEKLRQLHGLEVPALAGPARLQPGSDLGRVFDELRTALAETRLPFRVEPTAHLAILQFSKFRLWKDLDEHWHELCRNPLVEHLVHTPNEPFADPVDVDLTDVDLDELAARCPVPADASQLEAVAAAVAGRTFILEGPPGTGKSQTITNLLARAVAQGKRVLFMAEKRAALDVVRDRLEKVGMAPLSLDLHDKNSTPGTVRAQIRRALDHAVQVDREGLEARESELRSARGRLSRYAQQLHEANGAGLSLYSARARLLAIGDDVPTLDVPPELLGASSAETVAELRTLLADLPDVADPARPGPQHPWAFIDTPAAGDDHVDRIRQAVLEFDDALDDVPRTGPLSDVLGAARSVDDLVVLDELGSDDDAPLTVLDQVGTPSWEAAVAEAGQRLASFVATAHPGMETTTPDVLDLPLAEIQARAEAAASAGLFSRRKRLAAVGNELIPTLRAGAEVKPKSVRQLTRDLVQLRHGVDGLAAQVRAVPGMTLPASWNPLTEAGRAAVDARVRRLRWAASQIAPAGAHPTHPAADGETEEFSHALRRFLSATPPAASDLSVISRLRAAAERLAQACAIDREHLERWAGADGFVSRWRQTRDGRGVSPSSDMRELRRWLALLDHVEPLRTAGLSEARRDLLTGAVDVDDAARALERGIAEASVHERRAATGLADFAPQVHERSISRFTTASAAVRNELSTAIPAQVIDERPFDVATGAERVGALQRELARQRGGLRVRELIEEFGDLITQAMPCVLVSPDSLARFFPPESALFDLVVFDEASQIRVADAVGAMGRAGSVVVVGDSKQMPPTSFGEPVTADDWAGAPSAPSAYDGADDLEAGVEDEESILSECVQARVPRQWLSWHYRSQDESLIAFSNRQYYEGRLSTFPAPTAMGDDDRGVSLVRVDGHFQRSSRRGAGNGPLRTNPIEAEAVVAEIARRFGESPDAVPSIGVVTFNHQQRGYIESLLRDHEDERLADALDGADHEEGLFVKNLENVQGDERDVVLFSTAFSPDARGVLPLNFGPLNRVGGERRLNVAITRARRRVIVFSSFDPAQLRAEETSSVGIRHLRSYLELAARGTGMLPADGRRVSARDRHAEEIAARVREHGFTVATDVGLSDFKVDLTISSGDDGSHRSLLAVLLDGPAWAARRTVGDRDGLPTEVLTRLLRWPAVERVWLPEWLDRPDDVVDRLVRTATAAEASEHYA
ncbi:DUF4011 domain-containing protein [Phytoactinopolyspora halotolerans]|uniref:DUF4011 domain-containing protein n=1 Tax=Phytoactinopolyspora halotolerans TaxID=1981512 RepID=A0A6L9SF32_9ACTN|nr:DUF4011 domain-containing protein [Phytoactinopolyspora halotolerans]NEE03707.1 DUF4011 domain-containing protein [Phytoactinopolyspora halotolerans]